MILQDFIWTGSLEVTPLLNRNITVCYKLEIIADFKQTKHLWFNDIFNIIIFNMFRGNVTDQNVSTASVMEPRRTSTNRKFQHMKLQQNHRKLTKHYLKLKYDIFYILSVLRWMSLWAKINRCCLQFTLVVATTSVSNQNDLTVCD